MDSKNPQPLATKITPSEIKNKEFKRAMWGYNPKEVVEFLDATAKAWEKVQKQERDMIERIQTLEIEVNRWKGLEAEFTRQREQLITEAAELKGKAGDEARRMYAEVEERANTIRHRTEEWLELVIQQVEETERQRRSFVSAFRSSLDSHYELLKQEEECAEPLPTRLNSFLKTALSGQSLPS